MAVGGKTRRHFIPVVAFLVVDAMEAYAIAKVKASCLTKMPCWICEVPRESLNDPFANFRLRNAQEIYNHLDIAHDVNASAADRRLAAKWLEDRSLHSLPQLVSELSVSLLCRGKCYLLGP